MPPRGKRKLFIDPESAAAMLAEYEGEAPERTDYAMELLALGHRPTRAAHLVSQRFDVEYNEGVKDVRRARYMFAKDERERRPERKNQYRMALQIVLREAIAARQLAPAVSAIKVLCELDGVMPGRDSSIQIDEAGGVLLIDADGTTQDLGAWTKQHVDAGRDNLGVVPQLAGELYGGE